VKVSGPLKRSARPQQHGFTGNGLPVAMQLIGRPFGEAVLLRASRGSCSDV
jgi:hypothetical protein